MNNLLSNKLLEKIGPKTIHIPSGEKLSTLVRPWLRPLNFLPFASEYYRDIKTVPFSEQTVK